MGSERPLWGGRAGDLLVAACRQRAADNTLCHACLFVCLGSEIDDHEVEWELLMASQGLGEAPLTPVSLEARGVRKLLGWELTGELEAVDDIREAVGADG